MDLGDLITERETLCDKEQTVLRRKEQAESAHDKELVAILNDYGLILAAMITEIERQIAAADDDE